MRKLAAVVFCLVCAQGTVNAQYKQNLVTSAVVDRVSGLVLVSGVFGSSPVVTINGMPVHVISAAPQMLVAQVPASVMNQPGTYLLTVTTSPGVKGTTWFEFAVGAIGPQGLRGTDGAPGAKGDKGDQGTKGDPGVAGRGDKGDKGDTGGKGDKGDKGENGTPGTNGVNGTNGQNGAPGERGPAGVGALHVADAAGNPVGAFVAHEYSSAVIVNIGSDWVQLTLNGAALDTCSTAATVGGCGYTEFEEQDCGGTEYVDGTDGLVQPGRVIDGAIVFASGEVKQRQIQSIRVAGGGGCRNLGGLQLAGPVKSVPLSRGLTGALHLTR